MNIKSLVKFVSGLEYPVMDICGHFVLHSEDGFLAVNGQIGNCRVYWLRGGYDDDPGRIAAIEDKPVCVNCCGMVLTDEGIGIPAEGPSAGYLNLTPEDWGFIGEEWTIEDYLLRDEKSGEHGSKGYGRTGWYKWSD